MQENTISSTSNPNMCYINDMELYNIVLSEVYGEDTLFNQERIQVEEITNSEHTLEQDLLPSYDSTVIDPSAPLQLQDISSTGEQIVTEDNSEGNEVFDIDEIDGQLILQNDVMPFDENLDVYIEIDELFQNN